MTYRFKLQEPIAQGVRRIGLEQIDIAAAKLGQQGRHRRRHSRCPPLPEAPARAAAPDPPGARRGRLPTRSGAPGGHRQAAVGRARSVRHAADAGQAGRPVRRPAERRGRAAAQASGRTVTPAAAAPAPTPGGKRCSAWTRQGACSRARPPAASSSSTWSTDWKRPTARPARPSATPTGSPATRLSTPGARRCSCTGGTWRCCRAAGRRRCRRAPARPRSCRVCWARTTTTRCCWHSLESWTQLVIEPSDLTTLVERCRACQADLRAQAKPRGERLFAERADDLKERVTLYWTSAGQPRRLGSGQGAAPARARRAPWDPVKSAR